MHEAGRVEQDIGFADALGEGVDVGAVADVEPCRFGDAFLLEVGVARPFSSMSVAITVAPSRANAMRAGAADAGGGGGDEGAFAFQAV